MYSTAINLPIIIQSIRRLYYLLRTGKILKSPLTNANTIYSPYRGHCGDLGWPWPVVSSLTRVRDSGSLFHSNICIFFAWELDAVRIIRVFAARVYLENLNPESRKAIFEPKPRLTPLMVSPANNTTGTPGYAKMMASIKSLITVIPLEIFSFCEHPGLYQMDITLYPL